MQKYGFFLFGVVLVCVMACGKKSNDQLGATYFKMAFTDISDSSDEMLGLKQALSSVDKAIDCVHKPEYFALKGSILFKLGQYEQCEGSLIRALALVTDQALKAEIMNNLAVVWAQLGKYDKAIHTWKNLTTDIFYKTPEVALVNLGKVYAEQGSIGDAEKAFRDAVTLAPGYIDAHFYRAVVAQAAQKNDIATEACSVVLSLAPSHAGAQELLKRCV